MTMAAPKFAVDPQTLVGMELPQQRAFVEPRRLKFFLNTIGEKDPVYLDPTAARAAGFRDIPIPPTYMFCLQSLDNPGPNRILDLLGVDIGRILHGEQKFVYHKAACIGDELVFQARIGSIVDKKGGALTMVAQDIRVENGQGEHIADITNTLVIRNPQDEKGAA
ncbi:MaoC family dehydratase N-terminal domain-containing protein [Camelimonas fluminis]|uniref:MaoC family dehydratase N-terminal domain-containing protein n=1 Tax=Camelimonas fluminis TaxID=1576911 RepID=A0ABV7ULP4_9HYPH|nr:MaoC family dehydratase N-terminal domain-containing protein [Camelimonas fluminis]